MNICESCELADKIHECCGRFPDTAESVDFLIENNVHVSACPHLSPTGHCQIYTHRPLNCRMHTLLSVHDFIHESIIAKSNPLTSHTAILIFLPAPAGTFFITAIFHNL